MTLNRSLFIATVALTVALAGCTSAPGGDDGDDGGDTELVNMENFAFAPAEITIEVGTKVVWRNLDQAAHTVTSDDDGGPLDSGNIAPSQTFSYTFTEPGVYTYHCEPHPNMVGTITVVGEDGETGDAGNGTA